MHHGIHHRRVADAEAAAGLRQKIGRIGHRFHSAGDDDLRIAGLDGLHARATAFSPEPQTLLTVMALTQGEGHREGRLPRGILSQSGGDDIAHDALVHLRGIDLRPDHRFPHHERAQLQGEKSERRPEIFQPAYGPRRQ